MWIRLKKKDELVNLDKVTKIKLSVVDKDTGQGTVTILGEGLNDTIDVKNVYKVRANLCDAIDSNLIEIE